MSARAWVLNLDAESELEVAGSYTPSARLRAIVAREERRLVGTLVGPDDVVLSEQDFERTGAAARVAEGLPGFAWSPTPRALARLAAAGATPVAAPPVEVLRSANSRPFAARVREPFAFASFEKSVARTLEETLALLARPAAEGWLVRRTFGAAGRGRRRIAAGAPDAGERLWLAASLRLGPLILEPWVHVTREYTRSAWVDASGLVVISPPCFQETTATGAWVRTERAERGAVTRTDDARLAEVVEAAGRALAREGYFGPFGIDAYRHRVAGRRGDVLNPLSEINARFTMDWAHAMTAEPERGEAIARLARLASSSG